MNVLRRSKFPLDGVTQLVGGSSCKLKGRGFDSKSGHVPRLWVLVPVVSLSHHVSFLLSLSLPLSLKSVSVSLGEDKKRWGGQATGHPGYF